MKDSDFIYFMYDRINENYRYLEDIMGDVYSGKLNYEGVLPALSEVRTKLLSTQKNCENDKKLYDRLGQTVKYTEDIMSDLHSTKLNYEEVIPALGELASDMLGAQKHFTGGNEILEKRIEDKENALAKALESTKGNVR